MQDSRFQRFEISHPMHWPKKRPLHFTETRTATPNRTKLLGTAHAMHGLQKRRRVKFVCVGGKNFAVWEGIESARDFQGLSFPRQPPYSNRRAFRNGRPSAYFFSSIIPYNFISSMRSFASLMEPDALLSAPDCFSPA